MANPRAMMFGPYIALAAAIILGSLGQLALKAGADSAATIVDQLQQPMTIIGLALYGVSALFYIAAIKVIPVSVAFPSVSASYIIVSLGAHVLWNEAFGILQVAGLLLIGGGILLLYQ